MGHFAPVSISRELLKRALKETSLPSDKALADALRRLAGLGLVQIEPEGRAFLHRLLREFARQQPAPQETASTTAEKVAQAVADFAYEANKTGLPAALGRELEHLRLAAAEAETRGLKLPVCCIMN
jgi:DNA-binding GntR family transcriptional regulator